MTTQSVHDGTDRTPVDCSDPTALVVMSKTEVQQLSPFYLDPESAVAIWGAILMLWGVAWLFRMARKSLESPTESE